MSDDKRQVALQNARTFIASFLAPQPESTLIIQELDAALKSEPEKNNPDDALEAFKQTKQELEDLKSYILMQNGGYIRNHLLQLPDQIKEQSQKVADETFAIEQKRAELATIKAEIAFDIANDPALTNEAKRKAATEQALKARDDYKKLVADLPIHEQTLRQDQIELDHLNNLLRAYLGIAGMRE